MDALAPVVGQLFHIVDGQPLDMAGINGRRIAIAKLTTLLVEFDQSTGVHLHGVGQHRHNNIIGTQFIIARELNGGYQVTNAGYAQQVEHAQQFRGNAFACQIFFAGRLVKQAHKADGDFIINRHDHVQIFDIVNPGYMLVSNALDAMFAEPVAQQRRALQRFTGHNFTGRKLFFEKIATGDCTGRAGS